MAIEFNCPHCDKLLTTTDSRALALAKCPSCGDLITVPAATAAAGISPAATAMSPEFAATAAWSSAPTPGPNAGRATGIASGPGPTDGPAPGAPPVEAVSTVAGAAVNSSAMGSAPGSVFVDPIDARPLPGPATLYCPRCGQPAAFGATYCSACGLPLIPAAYPIRYAGFFRRLLASVIDFALIFLAAGALAVLVPRAGWQAGFFLWFFYNAALESSRDQATVGERMFGMIVCGADGRRLTFPRAAIRTLAKLASLAICGMGFIMPLLTPKKQALHDLMTDAVVVLT